MTIWHRRGCNGTTPRCRSRNFANNTFSEGWLQKSYEFAGLRTAPATHRAKNTANSAFSCGMLQNAGFGTVPLGGGRQRTTNRDQSYIYIFFFVFFLRSVANHRMVVLTRIWRSNGNGWNISLELYRERRGGGEEEIEWVERCISVGVCAVACNTWAASWRTNKILRYILWGSCTNEGRS